MTSLEGPLASSGDDDRNLGVQAERSRPNADSTGASSFLTNSAHDASAEADDQGGLDDMDQQSHDTMAFEGKDHTETGVRPQSLGKSNGRSTNVEDASIDPTHLDPTPQAPRLSARSSQTHSGQCSPIREGHGEQGLGVSNGANEDGTTSEIQSIIDQFDGSDHQPGEDDVLSPRLEYANSMLGNTIQHPPRKSSLEPMRSPNLMSAEKPLGDSTSPSTLRKLPSLHTESMSQTDRQTPSIRSFSTPQSARFIQDHTNDSTSPRSSISGSRPQPPEPDVEPEIPFDFHRFLEQLRHRTADPVAKFLRSFLQEFGKKQWMVHEQVKIISDFLTFITGKMSQCEVWRGVSDAEFDNAKEGMEKLVMNRLYSQTFSPAIPPPTPPPGAKGKRKNIEKLLGPGRKGQHQEDIERDDILGQKVRIYRWVQEEHLDIPPLGDNGRRFMSFAQQQLLKITMYRAPRDKVVQVLNCCKVIFGFLSTSKSADMSADSFVPLLIYVVLRSNPEHLVSNVQYILRFRNQDKLGGEAGYYLSSLMGAIQFIENLDRTSLTISDEEFEKKVEISVSEIAERHDEEEDHTHLPPPPPPPPPRPTHISEKSGLSEPQMIPRTSMDGEYNTPSGPLSPRGLVDRRMGTGSQEDSNAVSGLLRTIQRPLSSIGKMFSDDASAQQYPGSRSQAEGLPPTPSPIRLSPAVFQPPRRSIEDPPLPRITDANALQQGSAEDSVTRQARAETAEARRIQRIEHQDVVDTLAGMFPDLDRDIIDDVVREKEGRVGLAVDACLALNA
ncbi:MAG: hypothetical protein LQ352_003033 [Teloschistes flavicans]|nr:MAG: hypothetical protein LQ352_003033 [Teloschistes flavicans]